MKKKLFAILLALAILLSSMLSLSEVSFAQGENYVLTDSDGNVLKATNDANDLITYMNTPSNFDQTKSYTLTLNDNLEIPVEGGHLKTLEIHCNLTIEGNGKTITGAEGGTEGDRFIRAKTENITININSLNFDGSEKYAGIHVETEGDTPINFNLDKCNFTKFKAVLNPSYTVFSGRGACVFIYCANVDMKNCDFTDSNAYYSGGAIRYDISMNDKFTDTTLNLYKCNFDGCTANNGGAFSMQSPEGYYPMKNDFIFKECSFKNCSAKSGGAICLGGLGKLVLEDTSIDSCYATESGGAIYGQLAFKIELRSTDKNNIYGITNCKAEELGQNSTSNGGAIYMSASYPYFDDEVTHKQIDREGLVIKNYKIENCEANFAGAIFLEGVIVDIDNLSINNCKAKEMGGAIYADFMFGPIKNSEFLNNTVGYDDAFKKYTSDYSTGGAIFIEADINFSYKTLVIEDSKFEGNKAVMGGAIFFNGEKLGLKIKNRTKFLNNESLKGGAICLSKGTIDIKNTELKNNKAISNEDVENSGNGAAIYVGPTAYGQVNDPRTLNISEGSVITDNHADNFGGGIYSEIGKVNIDSSTIEKNTALKGAGLYIIPGNNSEYKIDNSKIINNEAGALGGGIYFLGAIYEVNGMELYGEEHLYNILKYLPYYIKLNKATFEGNTAGFGFYNPPNDIESIKTDPDAVSEEDYKALMSANNSCKDKLIIKDADGKWQHIESLINNYDIDYINPITTTTYMENFGENGIYVNQELTTKDYEDQDTNEINGHNLKVVSYKKTNLTENPDTTKPFKIWNTEKDGKGTDRKVDLEISGHKGNMTLFAQWGAKPIPPVPTPQEPNKYILTLDENYAHGKVTSYEVMQGEFIEPYLYTPKRRGYIFEGWSYSRDRMREVRKGDQVYTNTVLYAMWTKRKAKAEEAPEPEEIKGQEHKAYIFGYPDGTVRPNGKITRAEAAAMLARLLDIEAYGSADAPMFPDTPSSWYNKAINAVVTRGIMQGYPDGNFRPNSPITRAEFTKMIAVIDNKPYGTAPFADVIGHWAERPIGAEYQAKRILGYPDGTFRPDNHITRCEAAVILNKIFERNFDAMSLIKCKNPQMIKYFIDLDASFWGYNDMVEATNNHDFVRRSLNRVPEDWLLIK